MDIRGEQNLVFNITLAKLTGIYQMLDPGIIKYPVKSVYHVVGRIVFLLYICVFLAILNISGPFYWNNDMPLIIDYYWKGIYSLYVLYQTSVIVHHSDSIWNCLTITRYDFTFHSHRDRHILDHWRKRSVLITNLLAITFLTSLIFYVGCSLALRKDVLTVKNHDGSVGNYRQNLLNLYLFVSDKTYNAHYNTFYLLEASFIIIILMAVVIYDILLVTMCLAMCCQLQMICTAFESVGHKSSDNTHSPIIDNTDEKNKISNEHDLIYEELKTIIMDHQAVLKKYDEFLSIFKRVMLLKIVILSVTLIILFFYFIMSFSDDVKFNTSGIFKVRIFCIIPSLMFQIFAVCYLFGNVHDQKDSVIFALYSSNWTEMNMKCKKLILLTMRMNNANHKKLKFTRTKIVNLEMFCKTVRDCYTILSVLINYIKTNNE